VGATSSAASTEVVKRYGAVHLNEQAIEDDPPIGHFPRSHARHIISEVLLRPSHAWGAMSSAEVPEHVRRLILEAIDNVAELEALLLLRGAGRCLTSDAVCTRLYVRPAVAAQALAALTRRGFLVEAAEGFIYQPASAALADDVTALANAYSSNLIAVTQLIHAKPSPSMQDFARAFRIRRDS
jgi:hypothetical protein